MGNRHITKKTIKGKEGLHPGSRKAAQLTRVNLRTDKLKQQAKARKDYAEAKLQRPLFFLHALSSPNPLSLPSLQALITEVYIARHDDRINELISERRPGRPKSKELLELEEVKKREMAEYDTGMEVPDLTDAPTVRLMYTWLTNDTSIAHSHVDLLRLIRVSAHHTTTDGSAENGVVLVRKGRAEQMGLGVPILGEDEGAEGEDWTELMKEGKKEGMEVESR
ncbi:translation machinery-associated protein 16 [Kwoniella heveanensis BCC8398]|uniref:Translation machinery-associated protein 16 n=1 Tax=Kwoniella heveanensis BCC8398 TaxID=1296120 RepID=A0A1B9GK41_9TREE|nr:translation machinery-associated protein 16 [Kwoniella heveanensis BCC8398]